ncbi:MAG: signal peptidase I [Ignavibacteria bacterium]|nr:MAG: signal peptidase I [Ignavibacteria bacterium]
MLLIAVFYIICYWKVFEKAGQPGWAAIVPIYNIIVMLQIVGKPVWWIILMFIPCVNIVIALLIYLDMARVFGKSTGFGVGLFLLGFIFLPILAFGDAEYQG